jgi:hypothetical protein
MTRVSFAGFGKCRNMAGPAGNSDYGVILWDSEPVRIGMRFIPEMAGPVNSGI